MRSYECWANWITLLQLREREKCLCTIVHMYNANRFLAYVMTSNLMHITILNQLTFLVTQKGRGSCNRTSSLAKQQWRKYKTQWPSGCNFTENVAREIRNVAWNWNTQTSTQVWTASPTPTSKSTANTSLSKRLASTPYFQTTPNFLTNMSQLIKNIENNSAFCWL